MFLCREVKRGEDDEIYKEKKHGAANTQRRRVTKKPKQKEKRYTKDLFNVK